MTTVEIPPGQADGVTRRVIVFARVPVLGGVKSRLSAAIGVEAALDAYRLLLDRTLSVVAALTGSERELCVAGLDAQGECAALASRYGLTLTSQIEGDLGSKMAYSLDRSIERGERVVLVGSDCPVLTLNDLHDAFDALEHVDVVFAPADDGGYALVGAKGAVPPVFDSMSWSTATVMSETVRRLQLASVRYRLLRQLWDVDDAASFERWRLLETSRA
jgi:rSAM/selenodomain-associated transferase 1